MQRSFKAKNDIENPWKHVWASAAVVLMFLIVQTTAVMYWAGAINERTRINERRLDVIEQRLLTVESRRP